MGERVDCARRAAEAGGAVAMASFREELAIETKESKTDVVTRADRDAQEAVFEELRSAYPDEPVVGEEDETPGEVPDEGPAWIVDPIDGTNNYVRGLHQWTTSVAATVDGDVVAGASVCPALGDTYLLDDGVATRNGDELTVSDRSDPEAFTVVPTLWWGHDDREAYTAACRGILDRFGDMRRFGSTQLDLALCAAGAVDGVVSDVSAPPWDTVVGVGLVRAAGGVVTDVHGEPWRLDARGVVASNGLAHDEVLATVRDRGRDR